MHTDHRTLGDVGMRSDHGFHRPRRQPVPGDVDDVIGAAHDVYVAILIHEATVTAGVVPRMVGQIRADVPVVVTPQGRQGSRR